MKPNFTKSILILFCFSLVLGACKKDDLLIENPSNTDTSSNPLYSGSTVTTSIGGVVTNQTGAPVSNAQVSVGNKTTITNQYGVFNIPNVSVDSKRAYVKITKSGYFLGSRSFKPSASYANYVRIELIPKTVAGTFSNSTGGTINISGGASLTFLTGDVSLTNGNTYNGTVTLYASYLDPMGSNIGKIMPGDLTAVDNSNNAVVLETYGMIAVELTGANGEALNVTPGKKVEIKMPIATQQLVNAPSTIPLWYFNENQGNWVEEGQATLQAGFYVGEVSHFSFWNCDNPYQLVEFKCRLNCNGIPLSNLAVTLTTTSGGQATDYTDGNGIVDGSIPKNSSFTLEVKDECENLIYTQSFITTTTALDLGDVAVCNTSTQASISGTIVDCNGNGISNGMLLVNIGSANPIQVFTNSNGQFNTIINHCSASTIEVKAYNFDNNQEGATITVETGSNLNLGMMSTCDQFDEYIYFTVDGIDYATIDDGGNEVYSTYDSDSTYLSGYFGSNNIYFSLANPSLGNGTCQILSINNYQIEWPSIINANITNLGTVSGSYIEGTINGTVYELGGGPSHAISGSFRTRNE